jgi:CBS domain-containing protein
MANIGESIPRSAEPMPAKNAETKPLVIERRCFEPEACRLCALVPFEAMREDIVSMRRTETVRRAAELLAQGEHHSLPVLDDDEQLVGMVTSTERPAGSWARALTRSAQ